MIGIGTDFANLSEERSYSLSYYTKGALIHPDGRCALCRGLNSPHSPAVFRVWRRCRKQGKLHFPCDSLRCLPFCVPMKRNTLLRQAVPFHGAESRRSEVNRYRNLSLQHQDHQPGKWQVSRSRCCLPKRRENHKRMGRHDP